MRFNNALCALVLALLAPLAALAGTPADMVVSPAVTQVQTGGYWEFEGRKGHYRVVVAQVGFEHIATRVVAEWVSEPQAGDEAAHILRSVALHEALLGSVSVALFKPDAKGVIVVLAGEARDGSRYRCRVHLRPEGTIESEAPCR